VPKKIQVIVDEKTITELLKIAHEWQIEQSDLKIGVSTVAAALLNKIAKENPDQLKQILGQQSPKASSGQQAKKQVAK